jgi:transposase
MINVEAVYERCCGIDVHKKMLAICFKDGKKKKQWQIGTTTKEIKEMAKYLIEQDCQMIAMESTGSYWKPIYNILELMELDVIVVNAQHMKALPGRKTDLSDAAWIADLLQHGILRASFIPDREQRELREVVRYRRSLIEERSRELNRLQKMLESANIKLSSFVSNINGTSSRRIIERIITDKPVEEEDVENLLYRGMRKKLPEIMLAIDGMVSPLQKRLIDSILRHIDDMTRRIEELDSIIKEYLTEYEKAIELLDEIPGIGRTGAETILAEIGLDMSRFSTAAHLCSWAGLAPGNNESAGKRKSGKTTKGNPTLKAILVQCAKAGKKCKDSFFHAQYERIAMRRGKNRAAVAVAHSMLIAIYHILKKNIPYHDLGADYYTKFIGKKISAYIKKLAALGVSVSTA